jgi:starch-binding outer membrane protein, SusD/RagB family
MMTHCQHPSRSARPYALLVAGLAMATAACDGLLEVEDPSVAAPSTIDNEAAVPTTLAAAIGAFQLGFSGAPGGGSFIDSQVTTSGILSDEFVVAESFTTRIDVDQRETQFSNTTMQQTYARMHTARRLAEFAAEMHARFEGTANTAGHAHTLNLAGYSYVIFGENYCSGVPFSNITPEGVVEYGAPLTTAQMFEHAITFFDEAIEIAMGAGASGDAVEQLNLARVGRGRALLNLDRPAEAAATVATVPTGFVYRIFHSTGTGRQQNGIWGGNQNRRGISVSDREGGNGLPYRSEEDPRVPQRRGTGTQAVGFDNSTPLFLQLKYPAQASHVVLASGVEARLIEAEDQLRSGGSWLATLNELRAGPPAYYPAAEYPGIDALPQLDDPGNDGARVHLLFRERAAWLWLTSHRVGDMRRQMRQYNRTAEAAGWPTGAYFRGGAYGDHVSLPVPFNELNNPLFSDVFPDGCDPTMP